MKMPVRSLEVIPEEECRPDGMLIASPPSLGRSAPSCTLGTVRFITQETFAVVAAHNASCARLLRMLEQIAKFRA